MDSPTPSELSGENRALPESLPGHWNTASGLEMAMSYADRGRSYEKWTDLELANALYLENGAIVVQTAAKERMRWLSVQLALANARLAALATPTPVGGGASDCWVLQRNDRPSAVYLVEADALAECETRRKSEMEWREQNAHVADVRTYWNVYKADDGLAHLPSYEPTAAEVREGESLDSVSYVIRDGETGAMAFQRAARAEIVRLRKALALPPAGIEGSEPVEKIAPVQGFSAGIPWSMHLRAYDAYCQKWGAQPALIDLEGRGCRGGFATEELDMFIPGWRDELSEVARLRKKNAELLAVIAHPPQDHGQVSAQDGSALERGTAGGGEG